MKKKVINAKIVSNKKAAEDHYVITLDAPFLSKGCQPGQFVNVKIEEAVTDPLLRIPLGIHTVREQGIGLLYKVVGEGTKKLAKMKKGDTLKDSTCLRRGKERRW